MNHTKLSKTGVLVKMPCVSGKRVFLVSGIGNKRVFALVVTWRHRQKLLSRSAVQQLAAKVQELKIGKSHEVQHHLTRPLDNSILKNQGMDFLRLSEG